LNCGGHFCGNLVAAGPEPPERLPGSFEPEWSLRELRKALELAGPPEASHLVLEKLEELAPDYPEQAVACLHALVERDEDNQYIYGWLGNAGGTLRAALSSGNQDAVRAARETVNLLGAKGFSEFRELAR